MGDITEVIHKISYEVNDDALNNATKAIQLQIAEFDKLGKALDSYARQSNSIAAGETKQIEELSRKIDAVNKEVVASAAIAKGQLDAVFKGLLKGFDVPLNIKDGIAAYIKQVKSEFASLNIASNDTGNGLSGNIKGAVINLGKSLLSVNGLLKLGVGLFTDFASSAYNAAKQTDGVTDKLDALHTEIADIETDVFDAASKQLSRIEFLESVINDQTQSMDARIGAIRKMKEEFPDYFSHLDDEVNKYDKIKEAVNNATDAILKRASSQAAYEQFLEVSSERFLAERNEKKLSKQIADLTKKVKKSDLDKYWDLKNNGGPDAEVLGYTLRLQNQGVDTGKLAMLYNELIATRKLKLDLDIERRELLSDAKRLEVEAQNIINNSNGEIETVSKPKTNAPKQRTAKTDPDKLPDNSSQQTSYLKPRSSQPLPVYIDTSIDKKPVELPKLAEQQKGLTDEQKENIKEGIDGYQQLAQAAADAYNNIIQAQIDALDREISVREKRVEEAKKLAERGNTEALRLEEDRLRKAQEQRARFARQQQTVNAAITVSNAIAAVARAALEGGGFGSAATIAALIAALAAGYAAVSSMTSDTESFATGVVDYKGKGGPRDDKNWVRISSGESIITAAGTQKNRALLEAINQGAALHMIDPTLPMMMPMLKQPGTQQGNAYAEAKDLKRLETKLDEVVGAIENNKLKQNIFFNEQGVGIMTERAIQKDRKRWK